MRGDTGARASSHADRRCDAERLAIHGSSYLATNRGHPVHFSNNITENPVTIHDLQATILHLLGLDAWKLTYAYQGLNQKLIGPEEAAKIPKALLA